MSSSSWLMDRESSQLDATAVIDLPAPFSQQMTAGTPLLKRGAPDESGPAGAG